MQPVASPDGSAMPWVLDHYVRYPGSYEIPLRTMYSLNCEPTKRAPTTLTSCNKPLPGSAFSKVPSKASSSSSSNEPCPDAGAEFREQLQSHIARLPSQPCSLPPNFLTSFLRRCFAANLKEVDFPQALTGLDYLRDLETRRKKEVVAARSRLGITGDANERSELGKNHRGVLSWIESVQRHERRIESLYSQVYIGLRRWVGSTFFFFFFFSLFSFFFFLCIVVAAAADYVLPSRS